MNKVLRMNILGGLNNYIYDNCDGDTIDEWIEQTPFPLNENKLEEIGNNEEWWISLVRLAISLIDSSRGVADEPADIDNDCGFDPFMGCFSWDC